MEMERINLPQINLKERLQPARLSFDTELAEVLRGRLDLNHAQVKKKFGVSEKVIRRLLKQLNIGARKRGAKPKGALEPGSMRKHKREANTPKRG